MYIVNAISKQNTLTVVSQWTAPTETEKHHILAIDETRQQQQRDVCLLAESVDDVECSLHRLETSAVQIGLTINHKKNKAMHLGQTSVRHARFANGDAVDSCDKFEYLGVPTSNTEMVFRSRLSKALAAVTKLRSICNSNANDDIEIGLCRSAEESILLYELKCFSLTSTLQDKLDSAYRRILRYALGVHFPDCISNAD